MSKLTRETAPWPEVHHSSCKGMFPTCVGPGQHLIELTRHIVELSYFAGGRTVHSSGCRLLLPRSSVSLRYQKYLKCSHCSYFRNAFFGRWLFSLMKCFSNGKCGLLHDGRPAT